MEYNNIEGMILLSELSRRRIRSIQKIIRVGRTEVVVVLRVDKEKGYIDLSKRRVSPEEIIKCEEKYNKSRIVHSVLRHVAEKRGCKLQDLYESFGWDLYKRFGHAYEAFKVALEDDEKVFAQYKIEEGTYHELIGTIRKRLTPQAMKIRSDIEVTCFSPAGIDAIKEALNAGEACKTETADIKIKLVAPPLYVMVTNCADKVHGVETLEKAITSIEETIKKHDGKVVVKMKPRVVSDVDDKSLAAMMERAERENEDVSGDEDSDDDLDE